MESKNPDYAVGDYITAMFGWRTHTIAAADHLKTFNVTKINPALSQPKSTAIGVLGMPGYGLCCKDVSVSMHIIKQCVHAMCMGSACSDIFIFAS